MAPLRLPSLFLAVALVACKGGGASPAPAGSAEGVARPAPQPPAPAAPAPSSVPLGSESPEPNPLGLPARKIALDPGKRVFTFSEQMLAHARPGATLVLQAATAVGVDGDDLIIDGRGGPTYRVHSAYVIPVPDEPKLLPGDPVITEWNGVMKHGAVTKFVKDRIGVRFTDMESRIPEGLLLGGKGSPTAAGPSKAARFIKQTEGLVAGNFAALQKGGSYLHVLLVSAGGEGDARKWLALGFGGAAMIVAEADLRPIPIRFSPKVGADVWAEWAGTMRRATVQAADEAGIFTVKYERAGRPAKVGWGLVMAPIEG